jgi:glutamate-ammonia-ligase adenylyltransferase
MLADNQITCSPESFAQCGIRDAGQAQKNLELLRKMLGAEGYKEFLPGLFSSLPRAADPDMALNNLDRFLSALGDVPSLLSAYRLRPDVLISLVTIFGASRFLSTYLVTLAAESLKFLSAPGFLTNQSDRQRLSERLATSTRGVVDDKGFFRKLRLFRKQEMLRVGLRDLLGKADLRETVEDLSDLAEACLRKAYAWADAGLTKRYGKPMVERSGKTAGPAGFAIIAMGKLGGRELNFSSDVDLMYVYSTDGETEGLSQADGTITNRITNHQYFTKLAEKLSAAIGEKTEDGFVFRVDLRLRPEGQRGPLAQSLGGYELYYESWGQTWERSALIKARLVAGDEAVGKEFIERITPFVYRKYLDYGALSEIRDMKEKINKDVEQKGRTHHDVKLGYGGIREIEFVVQALQLIYAGQDRSLRERGALKALHLLSQKGLITYQEHADLARAYVFLRTVEHRIQLLDDLQTQTMPSDEQEVRSLARRTGYFEPGKEAETLLHDYAELTHKVRKIYDDLFAFTGDEPVSEPSAHIYGMLLDPETPESEAVAALDKYGFLDPGKAYRDLVQLREGPALVHQTPRSRKLFSRLFPIFFHELVSSPDPDMALNHLESFFAAPGSWESLQSLMRLDASATRILVAIFANSEYFSRMLVSRPELLQNLLETRKHSGAGIHAVYSRELAEALDRAAGLSEKLDALRRFKHQEEIRCGMADLLSGMKLTAIARDLSKLAEVCLDAALTLSASETAKRYGAPDPCPGLAIIGAGKLGGRELSYGSDLDILFVYSEDRALPPPPGLTVFEYFSKVAEKTIAYLSSLTREGFAFRIDTRLRPAGSKGPLVQSIGAFNNYYTTQAETWERQALLRTRGVAGDRAVVSEFCSAIQDLIYRDADGTVLAADIRTMRGRMEEEVGKESSAHYNIKQGAGGLVDIEFLVQYLQLLHGRKHPRIRVPGTYNALRALRKERLLNKEDCRFLMDTCLFLRQLESRMRIVSNQATSELSRDAAKLWPLARRMGYSDADLPAGQKLLHDYEVLSSRVRELFERLLGC